MIAISDIVQLRKDAPSGTIMINRPDRSNALSREIVSAIHSALEDFLLEGSVRAVILTGTGSNFCSGTDLHQLKETAEGKNAMETWHEDAIKMVGLIEYMLHYPKPLLAAVNGQVIGTGAALMLACDIVVAATSAGLCMPEALRGLSPALTAPLLSFRIGTGATSNILLAGNPCDAEEAKRLGLFHELTGDDFVWARCNELAAQLALGARESHQSTKQMLNQTVGEGLITRLKVGAASMAAARTTPAALEGINAFLEKRDPDWNSLHVVD
ncbi:MAG: enoyl-CoA hydratase/isomerase family protein [Planctomycetota bacterium]